MRITPLGMLVRPVGRGLLFNLRGSSLSFQGQLSRRVVERDGGQ